MNKCIDRHTQSQPRRAAKKPDKPRPDFRLCPRAAGRWVKKIRGKAVSPFPAFPCAGGTATSTCKPISGGASSP